MKLKNFLPSIVLFALLFIQPSNTIAAIPDNNTDWHYVLTREEKAYSVDLNSVSIASNVMLFWILADDIKEKKTNLGYVAIKAATHESRFEEFYIYDQITKEFIYSSKKPDKWSPVGKDSPMAYIVDYVFQNHPMFESSRNKKGGQS